MKFDAVSTRYDFITGRRRSHKHTSQHKSYSFKRTKLSDHKLHCPRGHVLIKSQAKNAAGNGSCDGCKKHILCSDNIAFCVKMSGDADSMDADDNFYLCEDCNESHPWTSSLDCNFYLCEICMRQPMTCTCTECYKRPMICRERILPNVVPSEPPTKEDIEIKRQNAIWKKDDMNQARRFRNQTEIQYCNAFNWKSTFVPEIQRTAEEQAQHTDRIEDKYLQHQISNAPRRKQKTSHQNFEGWDFQEKQLHLQQQQQNNNVEPHFHTEEEHRAPVLQFPKNQSALPSLALENQFQWRI